MALGTYKIPRPIQDEDKWLKLTKKQWLYTGIGIVIAYAAFQVFCAMHMDLLAYVIALISIGFFFTIGTFKMPEDKYIIGGGTKLDVLAKRLIVKQFKKYKVLYIKNYGGQK